MRPVTAAGVLTLGAPLASTGCAGDGANKEEISNGCDPVEQPVADADWSADLGAGYSLDDARDELTRRFDGIVEQDGTDALFDASFEVDPAWTDVTRVTYEFPDGRDCGLSAYYHAEVQVTVRVGDRQSTGPAPLNMGRLETQDDRRFSVNPMVPTAPAWTDLGSPPSATELAAAVEADWVATGQVCWSGLWMWDGGVVFGRFEGGDPGCFE